METDLQRLTKKKALRVHSLTKRNGNGADVDLVSISGKVHSLTKRNGNR